MRYMKRFAGFALVVGMAISSATAASAEPREEWRGRDVRMEQRLRAERIREARLREERLRAELLRERLRHHHDYDDYRR